MLDAAEELESVAALCSEISQPDNEADLSAAVLEPVSSFLGADMGVFRVFCVTQNRARLTTIRTLGVPERVNDAYLTRFFKIDPARQVLQQRLTMPIFADEANGGWLPRPAVEGLAVAAGSKRRYRQDFLRYRNDFLLPNRLYHHLGFCFQEPSRRRTFLFDFHRVTESAPFGRLEFARARILAALLHAKLSRAHTFEERYREDEPAYSHELGERLSTRELEVAEAVALGLSNKEIAMSMEISVRTVENHMRSIFSKLDVTTRTRLAAKLHEARSKPSVTITTAV
jgi:DNA-binding CsgD family transcriptional regulator